MTTNIDVYDFVKSYSDQLDLFDGPYPVSVVFVPKTYTLPSGRTRSALFTGKVYVVRYDDVALHTITMDGDEEVTNVVIDAILEKMGIELHTTTRYMPYVVSADAPCMPEEPNYPTWDDPDALPF